MKFPWKSNKISKKEEKENKIDNEVGEQNGQAILGVNNKNYDLKSLPEDIRDLLERIKIAESQFRMQQDTVKLISVGREALVIKLKKKLKDVSQTDNDDKRINS